ncbi:phosphoglycerate kinase [Megalodesulfovibrio paquesii]
MHVLHMANLDLAGKRVLIREDFNVPLKDGVISDATRLTASLPTIKLAMEKGARVIAMSHLGRPTEGEFDEKNSMKPVADWLNEHLGGKVRLVRELEGVEAAPGELVLLENVRMNKGEKKNDPELGKKYAALCDIFVMDAFGTAHRAEASTHAVAQFAPVACAGVLLAAELDALTKALGSPKRPLLAIVGGAKVSTKLLVLNNLLKKVDGLIVGGGIANTFLVAQGYGVGKSLYEADLVEDAKQLLADAKAQGKTIYVPTDVVVAAELSATARPFLKNVDEIGAEDMVLDVGPQTAKTYAAACKDAATIVWNGPVGVFEYEQFAGGSKVLAYSIADSAAFSLVGGGDSVAMVEKFGLAASMGYISTGGGSFLEFLEGKVLPAVAMLEERAKG